MQKLINLLDASLYVLCYQDNVGLQSNSSAEESSIVPLRPSDKDLHALSHLAGQFNSKLATSSNICEDNNTQSAVENVDLDNLFAFLTEIHGDGNRNVMIEEIENQMTELATDFDHEIKLASSGARY